jgi:sugar lactone lactonase YvrE
MKAIIYNQNGQILRQVDAPEDYLILQKQPGEFILFGSANDATQYIDVETAEIRDIPPKPNDYSEFNWQTKQWEDNSEIAKGNALSKRRQLLLASDWTDTYSASTRLENYNAWQFYRQQLRDITTQEGYPFNIIWPTQPV